MNRKATLNEFVSDLELLLISIIQGLAITTLAQNAIEPITKLQFQYWPYIISAFIFIFVFWSQAIIHTLTIIKWPIKLAHTFIYYVAAFVEFILFNQLMNPFQWFLFTTLFLVVVLVLYIYDLKMVKDALALADNAGEKTLYTATLKEHQFEMWIIVPAGILFNGIIAFLFYYYPTLFVDNNRHVIFITLQTIVNFFLLWISLKSFYERKDLINDID
jgi:hypothetical protein